MSRAALKVALVGFGYAGRVFHAPLIAAETDLELHTVVSSRPDEVAAAWPRARAAPYLDQALDQPVDLVVLATPNALHATQAEQALKAGRAVVVDKPFTVTVDEARRLAALSVRTGRLILVFHNRRWDADFLTIRGLIESGRLGRVTRFESRFDRFRPGVRDRWREQAGPGAGVWFDLGPHLLDQAMVLFGRPLAISADIRIQRDGAVAPDAFQATLSYERLNVVLAADMLSPAPTPRFTVQGDRAGYVVWGEDAQEAALKAGARPAGAGWGVDPRPGALHDGEGGEEIVQGPPGDYPAFYAAVAAAVRGEGPNPVPPEQAVAVMELIEAGVLSSELRAEVAL